MIIIIIIVVPVPKLNIDEGFEEETITINLMGGPSTLHPFQPH